MIPNETEMEESSTFEAEEMGSVELEERGEDLEEQVDVEEGKLSPVARERRALRVQSESYDSDEAEPEEKAKDPSYKKPRLIIAIVTLIVTLALLIPGVVLQVRNNRRHRSYSYDSYNYSSSSYSSDYYSSNSSTWMSTYSTIYTGSNSISVNASYRTFRIYISSSGRYRFYTTGGGDTYALLYDYSGEQVASNDDAGSGNNFLISYYCSSGYYYLRIKDLNGSNNTTLQVEKEY